MRIYDTSRNEINGKTVCMARMENHEDVLVARRAWAFRAKCGTEASLRP